MCKNFTGMQLPETNWTWASVNMACSVDTGSQGPVKSINPIADIFRNICAQEISSEPSQVMVGEADPVLEPSRGFGDQEQGALPASDDELQAHENCSDFTKK